ncbi:hypothetical protein [Natrialba asiatica]|uniref:Uncharacterized protein n=1 Tax=Natrialba asiatica (strain ATCC 700177 / DSM 12278 / JCM 9576 / FERM P-10747 / NBRC 102637 / 172P1) TaxID=29540 RepID=M0AVV6_NATA1|nr:hypothetical protein [Natrialba asiatica]ELZ02457.1 hypothetical protein C481_07301 [Natrialba asiatica DSM 12278]
MGDKKFTILELHIDGDQFAPGAISNALPFGDSEPEHEPGPADVDEAREREEAAAAGDEPDEGDGGSSSNVVGALVALALLVAAGVAVKKYRSDDATEPEYETETEPDIVVN